MGYMTNLLEIYYSCPKCGCNRLDFEYREESPATINGVEIILQERIIITCMRCKYRGEVQPIDKKEETK